MALTLPTTGLSRKLNPLGEIMDTAGQEAKQNAGVFKGLAPNKVQGMVDTPYDYMSAPSPFTKENAPTTTGALTGAGTGSEMKAPIPVVQAPAQTSVSSMAVRKNIPTQQAQAPHNGIVDSIVPDTIQKFLDDTTIAPDKKRAMLGALNENPNEEDAIRQHLQQQYYPQDTSIAPIPIVEQPKPEAPKDWKETAKDMVLGTGKWAQENLPSFMTERQQLPTIPKAEIDFSGNPITQALKVPLNLVIGALNLPMNITNMAGQTVQEQYQGAKDYIKGVEEAPDMLAKIQKVVKTLGENPLETAMIVKGGMDAGVGIKNSIVKGIDTGKSIYSGVENRIQAGDQSVSVDVPTGKVTELKPTTTTPEDNSVTKAYDSYKKAISPSITDTNTPAKSQAHQKAVETTGRNIIENKDSLIYTDKDGNVTDSGRTPETINEQSQALVQQDEVLYDEYRAKEKATGLDTTVSYEPVIKNLQTLKEKVSSNPELQHLIPYIDEKIKIYQEAVGNLDATIEAKKTLNQKLKSLYRNQNFSDIGKDAVDLITNKSLGEILDSKISDSAYGDIKQKWGANKQLQKETFHRDNVTARQKEFGFFDLSNPISAMEMIDTFVTGNPIGAVKAIGIQGVKWYMKLRNSPNTQIKEFYKHLEGNNKEGLLQSKLGLKNQSVSLSVKRIEPKQVNPLPKTETILPKKEVIKKPLINLAEEKAKAGITKKFPVDLKAEKAKAGLTPKPAPIKGVTEKVNPLNLSKNKKGSLNIGEIGKSMGLKPKSGKSITMKNKAGNTVQLNSVNKDGIELARKSGYDVVSPKFIRTSEGLGYDKMRDGGYHPELKKIRDEARKYELQYNKLDNDIGNLQADEKIVPKSMMEKRVIAQKKMRELNGKAEDLFEEIKTYESNINKK